MAMEALMVAVGDFLRGKFSQKVIVDDRVPAVTFRLDEDHAFAMYAPDPEGWKQLAIFVLLQSVIQSAFGAIIYLGIVQQRGTLHAYLLGWGIIVPVALWLPFWWLEFLDLRNKVLTLSSSTIMTVIGFRCLEAMYGTTPHRSVIESNLGTYCAYYSSVAPFVWNDKLGQRQRITWKQLGWTIANLAGYVTAVSFVLSIMIHYRYKPFAGDLVGLTELSFSRDNVSLAHLGNSYCQAVLVYLTLKTGFDLTAFGENVKGFATDTIFDAPFTRSRSPTEFWTRRWNLMIQRFLKGGVFLPIKKFWNARVAMFVTFVVSGLYHEYVWECIFFNQNYLHDKHGTCHQQGCYMNEFGRVTAFFTYVGVIMLLERPVGRIPPMRWLSQHLPAPITAHFLILLHLPVAQWYVGDWIEGGYFDDYSICTILIRKI